MNLEVTLQAMYDNYPLLFADRVDCLNHLFCVIGNGYDWVNGELVDPSDEKAPPKNPLLNGMAHQYNKITLRAFQPRKKRWYFYPEGVNKKYAYLFNYPADIKEDWLAAINECRQMLLEDGYDV